MFRAEIYRPLDRGMIVLQLCCWKFSVKETVADFIQLKLSFIQNKYSTSHHMVFKPFLLLGLAAE